MARSIWIFFIFIFVSRIAAQKTFTVPLTKQYVNNMKVADSLGNFYHNPHYVELRDASQLYKIESKITNDNDIVYYGNLWFSKGDIDDDLQFIFDTGSSWLWASVTGCEGCPTNQLLLPSQYYD